MSIFSNNATYIKYGVSGHVDKANAGDLSSMYILGDLHLDSNFDLETGIKAFEMIVNHFGPENPALNLFSTERDQLLGKWSTVRTGLAKMYFRVGRAEDGLKMLDVAASADDIVAMCMLYSYYHIREQYTKAFMYIHRVISTRSRACIEPDVFEKLGKMYETGKGVEKDLKKATVCSRLARGDINMTADKCGTLYPELY
jgi:TPR repeat protein